MRKIVLLACTSLLLCGCMGIPFLTVEVAIPPGSAVLGERLVAVRADHDVIELGPNDGSFTSLVFLVEDNDIEISDFIVTYDNSERERIPGHLVFKKGARSHSLDLHGKGKHRIRSIAFTYRTVGEWTNSNARVAVYVVR